MTYSNNEAVDVYSHPSYALMLFLPRRNWTRGYPPFSSGQFTPFFSFLCVGVSRRMVADCESETLS